MRLEAVPSGATHTEPQRRTITGEIAIGSAPVECELNALGRDEFLAMLAHELRNPLAPIRLAVQVFREVELHDNRLERARDTIERQVDQLSRLIDDLLDVARLTRGLVQLRDERVAIADVIADAIEATRPVIESQGHALHVDAGSEALIVQGDRMRLAQVVANLLDNAAKYTERGGRIWVSASRVGSQLRLAVADDGVGMAPELVARAFDLFEQGGRTLDRSQGGLGLGLTLVRRLVEAHGGSVQAHSAGLNAGSEFTVLLPLVAPNRVPVARTGPAPRKPAPPPSSYRVLVVDDNLDAAESLEQLLRFWHHDVRTAHDGHEALAVSAAFRPEIALLDIGLPGMSGFELARRLRALPALANTTLVALTGYGGADDRRMAREAGFHHHIVKPATPTRLRELFADEDARRAAAEPHPA